MSNKKPLIIGVIIAVILIFAANQKGHVTKSKDQIEYEGWLKVEESNQRVGSLTANLPTLKLKIFPESDSLTASDIVITSDNIPDGRERVLRLLQLIREAGLLDLQNDNSRERPGDIVIGIESPEKKFSIKFTEFEIKNNVKAALFLKLMQEYDKQKIPKTLQFTKKEPLTFDGQEALEAIPEELRGKAIQEVIPPLENSKDEN